MRVVKLDGNQLVNILTHMRMSESRTWYYIHDMRSTQWILRIFDERMEACYRLSNVVTYDVNIAWTSLLHETFVSD